MMSAQPSSQRAGLGGGREQISGVGLRYNGQASKGLWWVMCGVWWDGSGQAAPGRARPWVGHGEPSGLWGGGD